MKRLLTGGLLSLTLFTPLLAAESVDQSQAIGPDQALRVAIPRGHVTLVGTEGDKVTVKGTLDEDTESFQFESQGDAVVIKLELPNNWHDNGNSRDRGARLTIHYPSSRALEFSTVSADTDARELGSARMESVSGDFVLTQFTGKAMVETVSGDIEARDLQQGANLETVSGDIKERGGLGELRIHSVSGDLEIQNQARKLDLESVSGDVEAALGPVSQLRSRTVSGEMTLTMSELASSGDIALETVSGDIQLTIKGELDARISADTGPGGRIRNDWSDEAPRRGKYVSNESLEFTIGQGNGSIRLNTVSGDLQLKK
ncbi:DUF4097 family beta strand repeat-containing protein [Ferrimonas balearica]|uniref:DUF4097 family beta strand repeat-containing protein n=1 Tax=Ferrimonas balearica TaxID=44012 RepID=UPI001C999B78|nr:DUF4097 family beta strand repeat-containing protein [Ferrimonas balearica]MBY5922889.1 DUF4097 domain-containing protein [Ferrimonas balearica]MBY5997734.1 DUF4097 domain-containing protein [Ferrimonas balearica]